MADLGDVQHLFRHLNNLPGLRRSTLLAPLFARGDVPDHELQRRVRAIIDGALDAVVAQHRTEHGAAEAARWHTIYRRCDLGGELHEVVAAELGLSRRQFYRSRRYMHEALRTSIVRELDVVAGNAFAAVEEGDLALDFAVGLRGYGRVDDARSSLFALATSEIDVAKRLHAVAELVDIDAAAGGEGLAPLVEMATVLHRRRPSPLASAELAMIEASVAEIDAAYLRYTAALLRVRHHAHAAPLSRRSVELHVRAALRLAKHAVNVGNTSECDEHLAHAQRLLEHYPTAVGAFRTDLLHVEGELAIVRGRYGAAHDALDRALAAARELRRPESAMNAAQALAIVNLFRREFETARRHIRNALTLSDGLGLHMESAAAMAIHAEIELLDGRPAVALGLVEGARTRYPHSAPDRYLEDMMRADALDQLGRGVEAIPIAEAACGALDALGLRRYLGTAERIRAQIYWNNGRRRDAIVALDNAIRLLEDHGTRRSLARTYDLSARLTKNRRHRALARELESALSS
ncbi:MAG: hypothetical protein JO103_11060 [Candidatus Eremiobacteraeota bacterium]|nr:hypothetical protein [Candidatus Eremiobacteraeota bacterium]MBV9408079.1 hypothetical protein [Candidatus Eremiobacteraeota bacterium]